MKKQVCPKQACRDGWRACSRKALWEHVVAKRSADAAADEGKTFTHSRIWRGAWLASCLVVVVVVVVESGGGYEWRGRRGRLASHRNTNEHTHTANTTSHWPSPNKVTPPPFSPILQNLSPYLTPDPTTSYDTELTQDTHLIANFSLPKRQKIIRPTLILQYVHQLSHSTCRFLP